MELKNNTALSDAEFQEIRNYVEGQMSDSESRAFELKMLSDPFLSDAVDGFIESPDWSALEQIKSSIPNKSNGAKGKLIFGAGMIMIGAAILIFWSYNRSENESNVQPNKEITIDANTNIQDENNSTFSDAPEVIDVKSSDSSVAITIESFNTTAIESSDKFLSYRENISIEPLEKIKVEPSNAQPIDAGPIKKSQDLKIYHIRDYKVADYRGLRFDITEAISPALGTPANEGLQADENSLTKENKIPYVDFLEKAMIEFAKDDYRKAFQKFKKILETYPDDVNAQFYGGICSYESGLFSIAENLLLNAETNLIGTFHDEATYYRAVCLLKMGQREKAQAILSQIAESKSFYAKKASEHLK